MTPEKNAAQRNLFWRGSGGRASPPHHPYNGRGARQSAGPDTVACKTMPGKGQLEPILWGLGASQSGEGGGGVEFHTSQL